MDRRKRKEKKQNKRLDIEGRLTAGQPSSTICAELNVSNRTILADD
jgi:hypothetical protein